MGDLGADTAVKGRNGAYRASLSAEWEIWGPMGGYVAATALRAVGAHTSFPRPASMVGHYLSVAAFGQVDLTTTTLRQTKTADSTKVSVTQDGRPVFEALVWSVAGELAGPQPRGGEPSKGQWWPVRLPDRR